MWLDRFKWILLTDGKKIWLIWKKYFNWITTFNEKLLLLEKLLRYLHNIRKLTALWYILLFFCNVFFITHYAKAEYIFGNWILGFRNQRRKQNLYSFVISIRLSHHTRILHSILNLQIFCMQTCDDTPKQKIKKHVCFFKYSAVTCIFGDDFFLSHHFVFFIIIEQVSDKSVEISVTLLVLRTHLGIKVA